MRSLRKRYRCAQITRFFFHWQQYIHCVRDASDSLKDDDFGVVFCAEFLYVVSWKIFSVLLSCVKKMGVKYLQSYFPARFALPKTIVYTSPEKFRPGL